MDGQFTTNKENSPVLSEIISSILPKCDNAYFLVGYFYFSGFAELHEYFNIPTDENILMPKKEHIFIKNQS